MKRYMRNALLLGMWTLISMGVGALAGTVLGAWAMKVVTYGPTPRPRTQKGPGEEKEGPRIDYSHVGPKGPTGPQI